MQSILTNIVELFKANQNQEKAGPMCAYMKNRFPFLGISNPERKRLLKPTSRLSKHLSLDDLSQLISALYHQDEREFQYAAIDLFSDNIGRLTGDWHSIAEYLPFITIKSWWDSVDSLRKPIGLWVKKDIQAYLPQMMNYLLSSENMWNRRVAITLQLQWKQETDVEWLEKAILVNQRDHEFFIQKGIGWALREYSKTNKTWVIAFLKKNSEFLSPLAIRESSKYLHE